MEKKEQYFLDTPIIESYGGNVLFLVEHLKQTVWQFWDAKLFPNVKCLELSEKL